MVLRLLLLTFFLGCFALAQTPSVLVSNAWIRALPTGSNNTAIYMTIENTGNKSLQLTGAKTTIAQIVMPMAATSQIVSQNGVQQEIKGMKGVPYLTIPAKGRLELKPGGDHLMVMGLIKPLEQGKTIALELLFSNGSKLKLELPVMAK